jgi:putative ABC transport system permease protein
MDTPRQIVTVTLLGFTSLRSRFWPSLVIVIGMACAIGVLVSTLSLAVGYVQLERRSGDPGRAIVLAATADSEGLSGIPRDSIGPIMDAPGIRKDPDGSSVADAEFISTFRASRKPSGMTLLVLRGIGRKGLELRPELKIVAGRMFRPGARELIVGVAAQEQFDHLNVGENVIMPDGEWPVVGSFSTGGDLLEGQLIGDADTLMSAARKKNFNSVLVRLDTPDSLDVLQQALSANAALNVRAERQSDYYQRTSQDTAGFFRAVAFAVGGIMALGALFGALNTMYSAVAARTQEIGTLRALGFSGAAVAISVIAEALLLALIGALIGGALAWLAFDGERYAFGATLFNLTVTLGLIGLGIGWALIVAFLGGLLPAIRAARLTIVEALRST